MKTLPFGSALLAITAFLPLFAGEAYLPRVNYGARLEPKNRIIHGAGQDARGFDEYRANFDSAHQPLIYLS